jgi:transcriptional regulator with XRE-family HTH domain
MYIQILKSIMAARELSNADVAKAANISRAAVTKWFKLSERDDFVNVETVTLLRLAENLRLDPQIFLKKRLPTHSFKTLLLWDGLYANFESFIHALILLDLRAVARFIQVFGFADARRILGQNVIDLFPTIAHLINPARRKELQILWPLYSSNR